MLSINSLDRSPILQSIQDYSKKTLKTMHACLIKFNEIRLDPDGFQKICQVAIATIEGINWYCQTNYWSKFKDLLDIANVDDFYNALQLPYNLLYQIKPARINEYLLLDSLEEVLCENWNRGVSNSQGKRQDEEVRKWGKKQITSFLTHLRAQDMAYRYQTDFNQALQNWLNKKLSRNPINGFESSKIDLQHLNLSLYQRSNLELLSTISFALFDMTCIPFFLNEWNLIDLTWFTRTIGQVKIFQWVERQSLDRWVTGAFCAGFVFQFLEACRILLQDQTTTNQKIQTCWSLAVSSAEMTLNWTILRDGNKPLIIFLTFITKSLGLLNILFKPDSIFFENQSRRGSLHVA